MLDLLTCSRWIAECWRSLLGQVSLFHIIHRQKMTSQSTTWNFSSGTRNVRTFVLSLISYIDYSVVFFFDEALCLFGANILYFRLGNQAHRACSPLRSYCTVSESPMTGSKRGWVKCSPHRAMIATASWRFNSCWTTTTTHGAYPFFFLLLLLEPQWY